MAIPAPITLGDENEASQEKTYNFDHGKLLDLTSEAVQYVKNFTAANSQKIKGKLFRVFVEGGGCSGMQYGFTFDTKKEYDHIIPCEDIEVLLNDASVPFIKGSVVDYVTNANGTGLVVQNPQSKSECGCGISFSV